MPIDKKTLERLLYEEEGSALDFKRDQYSFEGVNAEGKDEILKDILAFANAWREATAYILIGVDEVKGGRSKIVGVRRHLDDARLHQFVNSKTQRPIEFTYQPFRTEKAEIGLIEIPIQDRPFYLKRNFGKLDENVIYKRDGSSTAIATPDEIAKMGAKQDLGGTPQLVFDWADLERRVALPSPHDVRSLFLDPLLSDDTFAEDTHHPYENKTYSQEIIRYTQKMAFLKPFGFRLINSSGVVGRRIRFVGSFPKDKVVIVLDWHNRPERPYRSSMDRISTSIVPLAQQIKGRPDPCVQELDDRWEVSIDFGDVRPREIVWTTSSLFICAIEGITRLKGELQGDNIPDPHPIELEICFEVEERPMKRSDVEPYLDSSVGTM